MTHKKIIHITLASLLLLAMILPLAQAQPGPTPGYSILGKVTLQDGSDAVGAPVTATIIESGAVYQGVTNATGWYIICNIAASVGDHVTVSAIQGDYSGEDSVTVIATSPLYQVDITMSESGMNIPIFWLASIAIVITVVVLIAFFLKGGKTVDSQPKRRRK